MDASGSTVTFYQGDQAVTLVANGTEGTPTTFLMQPSGYVYETVVYPHQEDVAAVHDRINTFYGYTPTTRNTGTDFPQRHPYQVALYDWLEALTEDDVSISLSTLSWDGTYASTDQLANLWNETKGDVQKYLPMEVMFAESCWYILDDGSGCGMERSGSTIGIPFRDQDGSEASSEQNGAAYWYDFSLPLAGGGNGNPYYRLVSRIRG